MRSCILVIGIVMHFLILAAYAKYTVKKNAFYFDDGNAVKVSVMEENSLTYELYLPKDGRVRVSTTLGDGSKDSFVVNLNKSEITLENYLQSPDSEKPNMKAQGEYLLVNKNFEDRTFKIRRFIFINKEKNSSILSSNGSFIVEYLNEKILVNNSSDSATEILYFTLDLHRRELNKGSSGDSSSKLITHGIGLYTIWTGLSYLMLITGRYMKYFYMWRMLLHTVLGVIILIISFVFLSYANGHGKSSNKFGDAHGSFGNLMYPWMIFEVASGFIVKIALIFFVHATWIGIWCRVIHMWSAYACIIAGNLMNLSGIYAYGSQLANYVYIHWFVLIIITVILEVNFRVTYKWKYQSINAFENKNVKEITMEEFLARVRNGKKLALFDDYVVDLTFYYWEHPGSTYVLKECIGCDLGKYFYGSFSMENWVKPVTHSRIAGKILLKLICGKIKHNPDVYKVFNPVVESIEPIQKGTTFMFKVKDKIEMSKDIWRVVFENKKLNIKKFYKGLDLIGRGYIISSPKNQVSRYYTTCNCMGSKIYEEYRNALLTCINDKQYIRKYKSIEDHYKYEDNNLELIIKFYKETKTGITRQINDATIDTEFYIDGPQGKGFNFTQNNSNGTHVIFMGGTGALPFMDLFAYLARKLLKEFAPNYSIFPDEEFNEIHSEAKWIVYGYFPSRDKSVGLEFCELVEALHKKLNRSASFTFIPVFTREGGSRLTEYKIEEILTQINNMSKIKRLFVCGPPPQNNMFQRCMRHIASKIDLPRDCYEIL